MFGRRWDHPHILCPEHGARRAIAALGCLIVPLWNTEASASGFALREYSFSAASTAFAGASAQSDSPAFLSYNAATGSGVSDFDAQFTLNAIYPTSEAIYSLATTALDSPTGGDTTPDGFILDAYEPGISLRKRIDDRWTAGFALTVPWGLGSRYQDTWAGRYYATETRLATVNANPSLAYAFGEHLSVAAGIQVQYAQGLLANAIDFGTIAQLQGIPGALPGVQDGLVEFKATDWAFGYNLGLLWHPVNDLSVGLSYRSSIRHELQGDVDFILQQGSVGDQIATATGAFTDTRGRTRLDLPSVTSLGLNWKVTPELSLLGEVSYTEWTAFSELRVRFANPLQPDSYQTYAWKDTWLLSGGIRFDVAPGWRLRAGVAVDQTPSLDATRDPRIPDATRTWVALGVTHDFTPDTSVEVGYAHLSFPEEPISLSAATPGNEIRGNLSAMSDADVSMISVQIRMR
jgi:long-chain fatty acid transport protein